MSYPQNILQDIFPQVNFLQVCHQHPSTRQFRRWEQSIFFFKKNYNIGLYNLNTKLLIYTIAGHQNSALSSSGSTT
jgi:hypothetical protein